MLGCILHAIGYLLEIHHGMIQLHFQTETFWVNLQFCIFFFIYNGYRNPVPSNPCHYQDTANQVITKGFFRAFLNSSYLTFNVDYMKMKKKRKLEDINQ